MRPIIHIRIFVAVLASMVLTQCRIAENTVVMEDVNISGWESSTVVKYQNRDTSSLRNMSLALHVNRLYYQEQIEVEICTMSPDSLRFTERVVLPAQAQWPSATAPTVDLEIPYRRDVHLRCEGEYVVSITPERSIRGVEAVGINFQSNK